MSPVARKTVLGFQTWFDPLSFRNAARLEVLEISDIETKSVVIAVNNSFANQPFKIADLPVCLHIRKVTYEGRHILSLSYGHKIFLLPSSLAMQKQLSFTGEIIHQVPANCCESCPEIM